MSRRCGACRPMPAPNMALGSTRAASTEERRHQDRVARGLLAAPVTCSGREVLPAPVAVDHALTERAAGARREIVGLDLACVRIGVDLEEDLRRVRRPGEAGDVGW